MTTQCFDTGGLCFQVWQAQQGAYSSALATSPARQQPELHALQGRESADGQEMQLEPISDSEPHAVPTVDALVPSSAVIEDGAQHHASSASLGMPNAARQAQAEQLQGFAGVHPLKSMLLVAG